jgi:WD40 repeat protein
MRLNRLSVGDSCSIERDSTDADFGRSCRVRVSILSRELVGLAILLGLGGSLTGILQDGWTARRSDQTSLRGHDVLLGSVLYSADGQTLVSCGWDKQVRLWDVGEAQPNWGREIQNLPHGWHVFSVAMTPDGKCVAAGGVGGLAIWTRLPGSGWEKIRERTGFAIRSLAVSPDGHTLAATSSDQTIRLWDMKTDKELKVLRGISDELRAVEFSSDGALLAATTFGGELHIWDLTSENPQSIKAEVPEAVQSFAFVPGSRTLAIAQSGKGLNGLFLWGMNADSPRVRFSDNCAGNNALAVSPDGKILASADQDQSIRFWDVTTGQLKGTLHSGVGWVRTLAFSPNGRHIAFGGQSGIVQLRDLDAGGKPLETGRT